MTLLCSLLIILNDAASSFARLAIGIFVFGSLVLAFIDAEHLILPDLIVKPLWVLGFCINSQTSAFVELPSALICSGLVYIFFRTFVEIYYQFTGTLGLGRGDIKLLSVYGVWFGCKGVLAILWVASWMGLIWSTTKVFLKKQNYSTRIPFGPFLVFGALCYLFYPQAFSTILL